MNRTALAYDRRRRVVRLPTGAELPVRTFLDQLGIDLTDILPGRQYLLFAGEGRRPAGGTRDIVRTFTSEQEARAAFRHLRLSVRDGEGWGELVALDARGRVKRLCWFEHRPVADRVPGR